MSKEKKNNKNKKLDDALKKIEKKFGKEAIVKFNKDFKTKVDSISTGSIDLDNALGVGGVPKGRIIELYGTESSGKTSLSLSLIREVQEKKGKAAYVDAEHSFDYEYAKKVGIKLDDLIINQPECGEQALDVVQMLVESESLDLIVVDSVASLVPKAELEGTHEDAHIGLQARLMGQAMRKLSGIIAKTNTSVIFINQVREKINVLFGSPVTTPGGRALKFYSSVRIALSRAGSIKQGDNFVGTKVKAKVVKSKVAPPFKTANFEIYFDEGLSKTADIMNLAIKNDIIEKAGSWYSYKDEPIGQGTEKVRRTLKEDKKLFEEIKKQVLSLLGKKKR